MDSVSYKTVSANKATVTKDWYVVDATNEVVGRLCSKVALVLRGKHKPYYTPHVDCGDHVVIINADKIRFTGKKMAEKEYTRYTGYPGGQRIATPAELLTRKPTAVIELALKGMLPKNRLGRKLIKNVHVYAGTAHEHEAQQPKEINLNSIR